MQLLELRHVACPVYLLLWLFGEAREQTDIIGQQNWASESFY